MEIVYMFLVCFVNIFFYLYVLYLLWFRSLNRCEEFCINILYCDNIVVYILGVFLVFMIYDWFLF